jgi:hypothetical protein
LPPVSVRGLAIHPRDNDLIIGTHGRGAYILDDIAPLQELTVAMAKDAHVFPARAAVLWQMQGRDAALGQREFRAPNPPFGALINYFVRTAPQARVRATVTDAQGNTVRELTDSARAGVNRLVWDLRHAGPRSVRGEQDGGGGGGGGFGFGGRGPTVVPGIYTVALDLAGQRLTTTVTVDPDPRVDIPQSYYLAQRDAALETQDLISQVNGIIEAANGVERQVRELMTAARTTTDNGNDDLAEACRAALTEIESVLDRAVRPPPRMGYRQAPRIREELNTLFGAITAVASQPTEGEMVRLGELKAETADLQASWDRVVQTGIARINTLAGGLPRIVVNR